MRLPVYLPVRELTEPAMFAAASPEPSARQLTPEQRDAVARRDGSLLLAAAAGSGKTSVLVERFVAAVLEDGLAPGRILAITFTDRAAGELRERVRARFLAEGRREEARDTEAAYVGTFHGFCSRLLRGHALEAGLDPGFGILDEARAARLRSLAFRRALGAWLAGEDSASAIDLAAAYGADRLEVMVTRVHEQLRSRGQTAPFLSLDAAATDAAATASRAAGDLLKATRAATAELDAAVSATSAPGRRLLDAAEALERARELLEPAGALPGARPPAPGALAGLALPTANGVFAGPGCEAYRAALAELRGACADHHGLSALRRLDRLLELYGTAYAAFKRERRVLDFDDLELMARNLLEGDQAVRSAWSARFELMMVDEFQDTNPRQLAILAALDRDNLFTVGDEFQSIYGFRHADVTLFRARRAELASRRSVLALARNFRSRPDIIDVIDAVFAPRFGESFTALVAGRADQPAPQPLVELLLTDTQGWDDDGSPLERGDPLPPGQAWRHAEARLLAQRIADLVADGEAAPGDVAVLVRATGDIPVYERALEDRGLPTLAAGAGGYWSHQQIGDLLAYLGALANPLDERALCSMLASPLVGLSPDALAITVRAGQAAGPGAWRVLEREFCADPAGGGEAPAGGGEAPAEGGEAPAWAESLPAADRARLARFCPLFAAERSGAPRRSIAELLERALALTGYERHVLGLRWGERRLANVHKLLRLARAFESTEGRDLRGFLDHAARQAAAQAREADAPIEDPELDAIRLMTVHAAKGLEFPVVAIADLGRRGRADSADLLVDGDRVGLRLVALDGQKPVGSLDFDDLRRGRQEAEAQEEERILYVAMTRARERLLLSGATNLDSWPAPQMTAPQIVWLAPALVDGLAEALRAGASRFEAGTPMSARARVTCMVSRPSTVGEVLREESLRAAPEPEPGEEAAGGLASPPAGSAPPPAPSAADLPPRAATQALSYSALADYERCGYRYYLERVLGLPADESAAAQAASSARGGLDARTRGSLVHRLLESLDFARPVAPEPAAVAAAAAELGAELDPAECDRLAALVMAVAGTPLADRLAGAARVHREVPFAFALEAEDPLVTGVIDAVGLDLAGRWLVVDYKSDRVTAGEDLEAVTEHEYGIQRRVYALAALRAGAAEVEIAHWYLERPDEPVVAGWSAADADALAAELHQRVRAVEESGFAVSPNPHRALCLTCPGRRGLCSWDEEHTLRERPPEGGRSDAG